MVRECRPPAREPARSWFGRLSTMATSTFANASSPANIRPVGPPPAITTAWFVMTDVVRHDPGLVASPRIWHMFEVGWDEGRYPHLVPCALPRERRRTKLHSADSAPTLLIRLQDR